MRQYTKKRPPKKQTRLSFAPVPASSSPGIERSPGSDKVANVRYMDPGSSPLSRKIAWKSQSPSSSSPLKEDKAIMVSSDEESIRGPSSARRTPKRPAKIVVDDDDDDDDNDESDSDNIVTSSPLKRRRRNLEETETARISPQGRSGREQAEIAEDVADLEGSDTVVTKTRTRGPGAGSAAKTRRNEHLEALKRRRAGQKAEKTSPSPSPEASENLDAEEESDNSSKDPIVVEDKDSDIESAVPEDLDQYEDDFVLQDDDAELGAPTEIQELPFEFSRHRYKRLKDHFKDVVEWMVHNKLNPAFPRHDQVYRVAFSKVKDEVTGLAGSQFVSSVWNIDFKRALEARPGIEVSGYPISDGHPCDACKRSKHPASYDIRFDGRPYVSETLEPVTDDDESEQASRDGDNEEARSLGNIDQSGYEIPDASVHFYLGRHCKTKAALAHKLIHWRYHLNEWVVDYLERVDVLTDAKVLERNRWSQKRRTKDANETVDMMDEDGEIDRLWRDFNLTLKTARDTKEPRF